MPVEQANLCIGLGSLVVGVLGFSLTFWQLRRTRKAAYAAEMAAQDTQSKIQSNIMLVDLSKCTGIIEEIKTSVRSNRYQAALVRVGDLISQLIQVRKLLGSRQDMIKLQSMVSQLSILRNTMEEKDSGSIKSFDIMETIRTLSEVSDGLNSWVGTYKYKINKEN